MEIKNAVAVTVRNVPDKKVFHITFMEQDGTPRMFSIEWNSAVLLKDALAAFHHSTLRDLEHVVMQRKGEQDKL